MKISAIYLQIVILKIPLKIQFTDFTVSVYKPQIVSVMRFFSTLSIGEDPQRQPRSLEERPPSIRAVRTERDVSVLPGPVGVCLCWCVCVSWICDIAMSPFSLRSIKSVGGLIEFN